MMKNILMLPNDKKDEGLVLTKKIINKLSSLGLSSYLDEKYKDILIDEVSYYSSLPSELDMVIVVGGDGSIIDASSIAIEQDIPLLGINMGKIGYLTELDPDAIDLLDRLTTGEFSVSCKMLLSVVKHKPSGDDIVSDRLAVNDVIISHGNYLGLADMRVENCRGDQVSYRADALVLSTPQGSTAYSLSAGGPIISHSIDCITVTPVSPHSFFNRSIVYGPEETIRVTNIGHSALKISIDGRFAYDIEQGESCDIVKSIKKLKLITFEQSNLFSTLSKKIRHLQDLI